MNKNLQKIQKVLIQINITGEISKIGVQKENIFNFFDEIKNNEKYQNIILMGIMIIGPTTNDKKLIDKYFLEANEIFLKLKENYKSKIFNIKYLYMGMSYDHKIAINGSNMIRLGQNIFGERIYEIYEKNNISRES